MKLLFDLMKKAIDYTYLKEKDIAKMDFKNLLQLNEYFSNPQNCIDYLIAMRWPDENITCVFCEHRKVYKLKGCRPHFKCASCNKQFSITKGTIFENSQVPLQKWYAAIYLISAHKKGISSVQLSVDIGVTQKTAWFMLQRIRYAVKVKGFMKKLFGVVQCDETYVGGKNKNRHAHKRVRNAQGRSLKDKTPVFGIIETDGILYTQVVPDTKAETLKPIIHDLVKEGSIVVTDEWQAYKNMSQDYYHITLKHGEEEYARGGFHTNSIEGFWGLLKRGIFGIYHYVSPKHLHRYCDEFAYRYNTRKYKCYERFFEVMEQINCRLTYKELISISI